MRTSLKPLACLFVATGTLLACSQGNAPADEPQTAVTSQCAVDLPATIALNGGAAQIGSNQAYREEAPRRKVSVSAFDIDTTEVTNRAFHLFVKATDYVTDAEKKQAGFNVPGGAVFKVPTEENPSWWQFVEGANWQNPEGPESSIKGREFEPVVQISLRDAKAYAEWSGRRLPTQAEWEYAANGTRESVYIWGDEKAPNGEEQANTWQGAFPLENLAEDGFIRRAPVGCFKPNDFGLYDMIGNVWEWTDTPFPNRSGTVQYIVKGGSFLCAPNFCQRYRASALQPQDADFTTNHIGFRTVKDTTS